MFNFAVIAKDSVHGVPCGIPLGTKGIRFPIIIIYIVGVLRSCGDILKCLLAGDRIVNVVVLSAMEYL